MDRDNGDDNGEDVNKNGGYSKVKKCVTNVSVKIMVNKYNIKKAILRMITVRK